MTLTREEEYNKGQLMRLIEEGFNVGNLSVVEELVSVDMKEHQRGNGNGIEGTKEVISTLRDWFPDFKMHTEDVVASGDKVWARFTAEGTNAGTFMGNPPTGRRMKIDVIDVVRFSNGKIAEHWGVPDQLGVMLQLGLLGRR